MYFRTAQSERVGPSLARVLIAAYAAGLFANIPLWLGFIATPSCFYYSPEQYAFESAFFLIPSMIGLKMRRLYLANLVLAVLLLPLGGAQAVGALLLNAAALSFLAGWLRLWPEERGDMWVRRRKPSF